MTSSFDSTHDKTSIVLTNPKSPANLGAILRASGCFGIQKIYYTGTRIDHARKFHTDTHNAQDNLSLSKINNITEIKTTSLPIICIELTENAQPLTDFQHPSEAIYVFGPEDGTITQDDINFADEVIYIPTYQCLNLAATVNITLYDRMQKLRTIAPSNTLIKASRDQNNRTKKAAN